VHQVQGKVILLPIVVQTVNGYSRLYVIAVEEALLTNGNIRFSVDERGVVFAVRKKLSRNLFSQSDMNVVFTHHNC